MLRDKIRAALQHPLQVDRVLAFDTNLRGFCHKLAALVALVGDQLALVQRGDRPLRGLQKHLVRDEILRGPTHVGGDLGQVTLGRPAGGSFVKLLASPPVPTFHGFSQLLRCGFAVSDVGKHPAMRVAGLGRAVLEHQIFRELNRVDRGGHKKPSAFVCHVDARHADDHLCIGFAQLTCGACDLPDAGDCLRQPKRHQVDHRGGCGALREHLLPDRTYIVITSPRRGARCGLVKLVAGFLAHYKRAIRHLDRAVSFDFCYISHICYLSSKHRHRGVFICQAQA